MKKSWTKISYSWGQSDAPAFRFGDWSAHRKTDYPYKGWRVSHAPTGFGTYVLADEMSRSDAIRIARLLDERVPLLKMTAYKPKDRLAAPVRIPDDDAAIITATFAEVLGA